LLVGLAVCAWFYSITLSALPQLDGTLAVAGLSAPVTVIRDAQGLPTIQATTFEDLFFAQGYVTAQDRLWQMDIMRRFAAGELAEILGPGLVKHDREQRILGLRAVARRAAAALSPRDRSHFAAYTRGVNAFLETHRGRLPVEFRILKYSPQPWTVEDSFVMGAHMAQELNHGSYETALEREKILSKLGPELTADLYVNSSWHDRPPQDEARHVPAQELKEEDSEENDDAEELSPVAKAGGPSDGHRESARRVGAALPAPPEAELAPGSNNWVISGAHTVGGQPLLSNDMHLGHQMPNLWYEAHLKCGEFDLVGVTLPGVPYVIVGHSQRIAWGFTNVGPTVEDVYLEVFNERGQYQTPEGWREPEHRGEIIHVKGQPDVSVDVVVTRHGPIITELVAGETRKLALRWTLYDALNTPFFEVDSAQNWDQFRRALSVWVAPSQNVVYADADGHIGYHATGQIPVRAAGDGSLPVNGADNAHEWTGYVPFDKLPSVFDPPTGIVATANGRITPNGSPNLLSNEWGSPWRTERIYRVLESGKKFSPADMLALQTDIYSAFDRFCAEKFAYALDHAPQVSQRARQAGDLMRDWDGRMAAESAAATVETRARQELVRLLLEPKLGAAAEEPRSDSEVLSWKEYHSFMSSVWLENVLVKQPKRWLPAGYASYEALLAAAVESAVRGPKAPRDLASWKWGDFSPIEIRHPVLGNLPLLGRWTAPGLRPQSGGSYTVKQVGRGFGPSERLTVDFSNLDQSTLNLVTGQAGNFLSPHYMDQWAAWYEGRTFPLPFSAAAVEKTRAHRLVLEPGK
jgi:penicillin amidase